MKKSILSLAIVALLFACKTNQTTTNPVSEKSSQQRGEKPNLDEMFTTMDINKDGKLSKTEVKGPLSEKFTEIDTDKDGFLSKEELKNAPKPERQGPPSGEGRRN